jgi:hypothetical protein
MKIVARAFALVLGVAFATPALADDAVTAVAAATDAPAVVASAQLDPVLDVALVEASAAADTNVLGLSPSVTTGLIFIVVAFTLFTVGTDGSAGN